MRRDWWKAIGLCGWIWNTICQTVRNSICLSGGRALFGVHLAQSCLLAKCDKPPATFVRLWSGTWVCVPHFFFVCVPHLRFIRFHNSENVAILFHRLWQIFLIACNCGSYMSLFDVIFCLHSTFVVAYIFRCRNLKSMVDWSWNILWKWLTLQYAHRPRLFLVLCHGILTGKWCTDATFLNRLWCSSMCTI